MFASNINNSNTWAVAGVALLALGVYLYQRLTYQRLQRFAYLPQVSPSIFWGHMATLSDYLKTGGHNMDNVFGSMCKSIGNPDIMFIDVRPFNLPLLFVRTADVAEQISRQTKALPYSTGKSPTFSFLYPLIGRNSIIISDGQKWRDIRKRLNPGFAPQHIMTFIPVIFDKTEPFIAHLKRYAQTGEAFTLAPLCTGLTFDIIGAVTMGYDFEAQLPEHEQSEFIKIYSELLSNYHGEDGGTPTIVQIPTILRRHRGAKRLDAFISNLIREKFDELKNRGEKSRSVLALSLQDEEHLTDYLISETADSLKSFMFAGHDTTSILLQWVFYELSRHPRVLKTLRAELDELFGTDPDPQVVRSAFAEKGEEVMRQMAYTSAIIKEALRLYPPAGTARYMPPGSNFHLKLSDGSNVNVDGFILYPCHQFIQRDEAIYGPTADDFVPERWLGNTNTWAPEHESEMDPAVKSTVGDGGQIPAAAWRPFERGPRNCIGQELANVEARVIIATIVRMFDFTKVGAGEAKLDADGNPIVDEKGVYVSDSEVYTARQVTSRPHDGIEVRVKLRET